MPSRADREHDVLVVACAISAGIHAALTPEHFREETGAGVGFLVSAVVLAVLCLALTLRPASRRAVGAAGAVLAGLVVAYALATTAGVPVLHPEVEPADGLGLVTKAIELVGLAAALHLTAVDRPVGRLTRLQPKGTTR
jgi:drug/metabolite transporter (DMT)-like permease